MSKKPTVLMILDGYGLNDKCEHNAVCEAKTPIMDQLMSQCPYVKGQASGLAVGLPDGRRPRCISGADQNHESNPGRRFLRE